MSTEVERVKPMGRWTEFRREAGRSLIAVVIALVVAFVVIFLTSKAPLDALSTLLTAPLGRPRTIGLWIDDAAKLTVTGLAFSAVTGGSLSVQRLSTTTTATIRRYVRVATTGTFSNAQFAVNFVRYVVAQS